MLACVPRARLGVALLLAGAAVVASAPSPAGAATATPPPLDLLAVVGTNSHLYVRFSTDPGWSDLGGRLTDTPALAAGEDDAYLLGTGGDGAPYVRGFGADQGWRRLGPDGARCAGLSTAVNGATLSVACRGPNGKLYTGTTTLVPGEVPHVSRFTSRGGDLLYGSLTTVLPDGSFGYLVVGTNHAVYATTSTTTGFERVTGAPRCYGSLSADDVSGAGPACRAQDGSVTVTANDPADADGLVTLPGKTVGRPGVAVDEDGTSRYYVVGEDTRLSTGGEPADGTITPPQLGPSGKALYGVVAASLTEPAAASVRQQARAALTR